MEANPYEAPKTNEPVQVLGIKLPWNRRRKLPWDLLIDLLVLLVVFGPIVIGLMLLVLAWRLVL